MEPITLTSTAGSLLAAIDRYDIEFLNATLAEQMRVIGCNRRQTYSLARRELEYAGFIQLVPRPGKEPLIQRVSQLHTISYTHSFNHHSGGNQYRISSKNDSMICNGQSTAPTIVDSDLLVSRANGSALPENSAIPITEIVTPPITESVGTTKSVITEIVVPTESVITESVAPTKTVIPSVQDVCEAADDMDDTGEITGRGKTPADIRRVAQVAAVQSMFLEEFPEESEYPLQKPMATKWLKLCGYSACMVRDFVREQKRWKAQRNESITSPKTFIERGLERKYARDVVAEQAPAKPSVDLSNQFSKAPSGLELREPDQNDPYVQKLLARRAAKGLNTNVPISALQEAHI